ncbi:MTH1187 family thiamine-binding protein [Planctomycetota bacterium]
MKVIADFCIVPIGVGTSVSKYIAAATNILKQAGLKTLLHAYGTNVEGSYDEVFAALKKCHEKIHDMGAPRISTTIKLGTRTDRHQSMQDKIKSVTDKIEK